MEFLPNAKQFGASLSSLTNYSASLIPLIYSHSTHLELQSIIRRNHYSTRQTQTIVVVAQNFSIFFKTLEEQKILFLFLHTISN